MTESIGIDVGGTFTDLVGVREDGTVRTGKVLSTPADQSEGVERSLREAGADGATVTRIVHGTTVVTNMLLERTGARVVLCSTAGATDLLELRRQERWRCTISPRTIHHRSCRPTAWSPRMSGSRLRASLGLSQPKLRRTWRIAWP